MMLSSGAYRGLKSAFSAIVIAVGALFMTGCSVLPVAAPIEGGSVILTDKTMTDHIVSFSSGKNCSVIRQNQGLTYCEEDEIAPVQGLYCYQTLGSVTCYDRPDPFNGRQKKIGENDHNYVRKR